MCSIEYASMELQNQKKKMKKRGYKYKKERQNWPQNERDDTREK